MSEYGMDKTKSEPSRGPNQIVCSIAVWMAPQAMNGWTEKEYIPIPRPHSVSFFQLVLFPLAKFTWPRLSICQEWKQKRILPGRCTLLI